MANKINEYQPQTVSHPGLTLVEKLKEIEMGNKEFAIRVDKPEKTITAVTKGKSSITAEMAIKFEGVLKIPASFWLNRQRRYDEYLARLNRQEDIVAAYQWAKKFPYAKMASLGWVRPTRKIEEKVAALFDFFGVSNHKAWEAYYYNKELKIRFRISLAQTKESQAISAWLRKGELQANDLMAPPYNMKLLKKSLPQLKTLIIQNPENLFSQVQELCLQAGVKIVFTQPLPKAPIHGTSRWIGETPLIQLASQYKSRKQFSLTLFHEIGHIILHGKKYISIENVYYSEQDMPKEQEANDFAAKYIKV